MVLRNSLAYAATFLLTGLVVSLIPVKELLGKMKIIDVPACATCSQKTAEPKPMKGPVPACTSLALDRMPEPELAKKAGFASPEAAAAYVAENKEAFEAIGTAFRGAMNDRFREVITCMQFDKEVHPVTRLRVQWHLKYSLPVMEASDFRLHKVEGLPAVTPELSRCFEKSFTKPIAVKPGPKMPAVSYNGVFPLPVSFKM